MKALFSPLVLAVLVAASLSSCAFSNARIEAGRLADFRKLVADDCARSGIDPAPLLRSITAETLPAERQPYMGYSLVYLPRYHICY